jgi:hypothetical protein
LKSFWDKLGILSAKNAKRITINSQLSTSNYELRTKKIRQVFVFK